MIAASIDNRRLGIKLRRIRTEIISFEYIIPDVSACGDESRKIEFPKLAFVVFKTVVLKIMRICQSAILTRKYTFIEKVEHRWGCVDDVIRDDIVFPTEAVPPADTAVPAGLDVIVV